MENGDARSVAVRPLTHSPTGIDCMRSNRDTHTATSQSNSRSTPIRQNRDKKTTKCILTIERTPILTGYVMAYQKSESTASFPGYRQSRSSSSKVSNTYIFITAFFLPSLREPTRFPRPDVLLPAPFCNMMNTILCWCGTDL